VARGCIERFDPSVDCFPDKAVIEFARNFTVEYHKSYKLLTVFESYKGGPLERYILLQCGAPKPALRGPLASATVVPIPISSMFSGSTSHLPLLMDLDRVEVVSGVAKAGIVMSPPSWPVSKPARSENMRRPPS
jgi:iron complex transport system substrate-binding protein